MSTSAVAIGSETWEFYHDTSFVFVCIIKLGSIECIKQQDKFLIFEICMRRLPVSITNFDSRTSNNYLPHPQSPRLGFITASSTITVKRLRILWLLKTPGGRARQYAYALPVRLHVVPDIVRCQIASGDKGGKLRHRHEKKLAGPTT